VDKVRVAVVGVGKFGRLHVQKYREVEGVELVGVCDVDPDVGGDVARRHGTEYFADHRELAGLVDAVTIAASTPAHFELARFFLEQGVHVLVEKPMTCTSDEGTVLTDLARERGLKLQVGLVERFNPALLSAKNDLHRVRFIECHRLAPFSARSSEVSVVLDLMIHDLDVILSLVNAEPVSVSAAGAAVLSSTIDIANARIEFAGGAVANVTASRVSSAAQRRFRVFHQNQYLSIDFGTGEVKRITSECEQPEGRPVLTEENWNLEKGDALLAETQSFVDSIRNDTPCRVTGHDGVVALKLAEAVIEEIGRHPV
jgi:predicted dehydrogenase